VSCEIETFDAEYWRRFWVALGVERTAIAAGWPPFQQRFATATCTLPTALQSAVAALDYRSVRAAAEAAGVSILPVRAADASGIPIPASPWRLRPLTCPGDDAPGTAGAVPALPPLGPQGLAPLAGLRVVEATNRVQGPLAGHLLGLLGAEVVRLEPPGGDPMRGVPPMAGDCSARFLALNRGKGAVEADLKSVSGRRTALRLTASAHVFLHNWPPGRAVRFELDHDDLAAVRPSLVYAHAGGWADTLPAPQPLGTDYLVQAHTGVAALLSGPDAPPTPTLMTITDVLGALISAEGIVAALLARARTGLGMRAETALVDAAFLIHDTATTGSGPAPGTCPSTGTGTTLCPVTDLAAMAADPTFSAALDTGGAATYSSAPWTFAPPVPHRSEPTPHRSLPLRADAAPFQGGHRP
jgi:hypothetical protein